MRVVRERSSLDRNGAATAPENRGADVHVGGRSSWGAAIMLVIVGALIGAGIVYFLFVRDGAPGQNEMQPPPFTDRIEVAPAPDNTLNEMQPPPPPGVPSPPEDREEDE